MNKKLETVVVTGLIILRLLSLMGLSFAAATKLTFALTAVVAAAITLVNFAMLLVLII